MIDACSEQAEWAGRRRVSALVTRRSPDRTIEQIMSFEAILDPRSCPVKQAIPPGGPDWPHQVPEPGPGDPRDGPEAGQQSAAVGDPDHAAIADPARGPGPLGQCPGDARPGGEARRLRGPLQGMQGQRPRGAVRVLRDRHVSDPRGDRGMADGAPARIAREHGRDDAPEGDRGPRLRRPHDRRLAPAGAVLREQVAGPEAVGLVPVEEPGHVGPGLPDALLPRDVAAFALPDARALPRPDPARHPPGRFPGGPQRPPGAGPPAQRGSHSGRRRRRPDLGHDPLLRRPRPRVGVREEPTLSTSYWTREALTPARRAPWPRRRGDTSSRGGGAGSSRGGIGRRGRRRPRSPGRRGCRGSDG